MGSTNSPALLTLNRLKKEFSSTSAPFSDCKSLIFWPTWYLLIANPKSVVKAIKLRVVNCMRMKYINNKQRICQQGLVKYNSIPYNRSMTDLNPLIRVRRHSVEQKQKFLAELYRQAEALQEQKDTLLGTMVKEREKVEELGVAMLTYFGPYSEAVKGRVEDIEAAMKKLNARIDVARDAMREAYAELKKVEITQERREEEEAAAINKKESNELDDIAIDIFRRQKNKSKSK